MCYVKHIGGCFVMMVGWIAILFSLACFLVGFFSLHKFGPAEEGEGGKKIRNGDGFKRAGEGSAWGLKRQMNP